MNADLRASIAASEQHLRRLRQLEAGQEVARERRLWISVLEIQGAIVILKHDLVNAAHERSRHEGEGF